MIFFYFIVIIVCCYFCIAPGECNNVETLFGSVICDNDDDNDDDDDDNDDGNKFLIIITITFLEIARSLLQQIRGNNT